jgi:hypothetical protein
VQLVEHTVTKDVVVGATTAVIINSVLPAMVSALLVLLDIVRVTVVVVNLV